MFDICNIFVYLSKHLYICINNNKGEMAGLVEKLKDYLENNSIEDIIEIWRTSEEMDNVGVTVDDFINCNNYYYRFDSVDPPFVYLNSIENKISPEFSSGFLFN